MAPTLTPVTSSGICSTEFIDALARTLMPVTRLWNLQYRIYWRVGVDVDACDQLRDLQYRIYWCVGADMVACDQQVGNLQYRILYSVHWRVGADVDACDLVGNLQYIILYIDALARTLTPVTRLRNLQFRMWSLPRLVSKLFSSFWKMLKSWVATGAV